MRALPTTSLLAGALLVGAAPGCAPDPGADADSDASADMGDDADTGADSDSDASTDTSTNTDTSADADAGGLSEDEQLCLDWCLSGIASGCSGWAADEQCYSSCMNLLELNAGDPCEAERRAALTCEAGVDTRTEFFCQSLECSDDYKRDDLCRGYCAHLGGVPFSGSSQTECRWGSQCYGYEFEAECSAGAEPSQCQCTVDGELLGTCEMAAVQPISCGDDDLHVFTSCCGALFEGVLLP